MDRVLELGVNQGVSTCYAAAAVASLGAGTVVAIDQYQAAAYRPGVVTFAQQLGLAIPRSLLLRADRVVD